MRKHNDMIVYISLIISLTVIFFIYRKKENKIMSPREIKRINNMF
jgi:hypothetical protein